MDFYAQQVYRIQKEVYADAYLFRQISLAKEFMELHFAEDIRLSEIAGAACLSKFYFIRVFKMYYGRTPLRYLASLRMQKAKAFLQEGFSVTDTCVLVGFSSLSSFHRHFKQSMGKAPSSMQKSNPGQIPFRFIPEF